MELSIKAFTIVTGQVNFSNICLFGYPLNSKLLTLQSLNWVVINEVKMNGLMGLL